MAKSSSWYVLAVDATLPGGHNVSFMMEVEGPTKEAARHGLESWVKASLKPEELVISEVYAPGNWAPRARVIYDDPIQGYLD